MRSWDIGRALIAARADGSSFGFLFDAEGLSQNAPFKSLVVFLFVVRVGGIVGLIVSSSSAGWMMEAASNLSVALASFLHISRSSGVISSSLDEP
jgi:hypothetical protein